MSATAASFPRGWRVRGVRLRVRSGQHAFRPSTMVGSASVLVTRFVGLEPEVVEWSVFALRERAVVAGMRIKAVVHVAVEAVGTMEGSCPDEHAADTPIGAVVSVWRTSRRAGN